MWFHICRKLCTFLAQFFLPQKLRSRIFLDKYQACLIQAFILKKNWTIGGYLIFQRSAYNLQTNFNVGGICFTLSDNIQIHVWRKTFPVWEICVNFFLNPKARALWGKVWSRETKENNHRLRPRQKPFTFLDSASMCKGQRFTAF